MYEEAFKKKVSKETWANIVNTTKNTGLGFGGNRFVHIVARIVSRRTAFPFSLCSYLAQLLLGSSIENLNLKRVADIPRIAKFVFEHPEGFPKDTVNEAKTLLGIKKKKTGGRKKGSKNKVKAEV